MLKLITIDNIGIIPFAHKKPKVVNLGRNVLVMLNVCDKIIVSLTPAISSSGLVTIIFYLVLSCCIILLLSVNLAVSIDSISLSSAVLCCLIVIKLL